MKKPLALCCMVVASLTLSTHAQAQPNKIDARWAELASPDEGRATRALLALAATPKETTAFLKDNLKPVKPDTKRVGQLIKQLDSNNFVARTQAMTELEYFGKYVRAELESALKEKPGVETKMRIEQLIEKMPPVK